MNRNSRASISPSPADEQPQQQQQQRPTSQHFSSSKGSYTEISLFMYSPLLLLVACPTICFLIYYSHFAGLHLSDLLFSPGDFLRAVVREFPYPTLRAYAVVWVFLLFEFVLLKIVPGPEHLGPISPAGLRPPYRQNGMACYFISIAAFVGASWGLGAFAPSIFYDEFGPLVSALNSSALLICALLLIKGKISPSGRDNVDSGYLIGNYFWGIELYPYLFGVSLKQLVNSRFGLMGWNLIIISYAFAQHARHGFVSNSMLVSIALQSLYIAKFFYWECGYFGSIDIIHDRFGFMLCWGCMAWVTTFYTCPTLWLVSHPIQYHFLVATAIFLFGALCIAVNYDSDRQRQVFRESNGRCAVWGSAPKSLVARYRTKDGQEHTNLLLCSGWWGLARHFNYVPELLLTLAWALPAGFESLFPYSYLIFLTLLLVDRSSRDEMRCSAKYGKDWDEYCKLVPSKMIPGIY